MIPKHSAHFSVQKIKRESSKDREFKLVSANFKDKDFQITSNVNKTKVPCETAIKFTKMSTDISDCHIAKCTKDFYMKT